MDGGQGDVCVGAGQPGGLCVLGPALQVVGLQHVHPTAATSHGSAPLKHHQPIMGGEERMGHLRELEEQIIFFCFFYCTKCFIFTFILFGLFCIYVYCEYYLMNIHLICNLTSFTSLWGLINYYLKIIIITKTCVQLMFILG